MRFLPVCLLVFLPLLAPSAFAGDIVEQRRQYRDALAALRADRLTQFQKLREDLLDYPLYPYLEYHYLRKRMNTLPEQELQDFIAKWPDTPLVESLRASWLYALAQKKEWKRYEAVFQPGIKSLQLRCYHLQARWHNGARKEALDGISEIWVAPASLPKACDPLLKEWQKDGRLDDAMVWERMGKALEANQVSLANYLVTQLGDASRALGDLYVRTHRHPDNLRHGERYAGDQPRIREIVLHGIRRQSGRNAEQALSTWQDYQGRLGFTAAERSDLDRKLAISLASGYRSGARKQLLTADPNYLDKDIQAWRLRYALRELDWPTVQHAAGQLRQLEPDSADWPYWQARALLELNPGVKQIAQARALFAGVAHRRQFYGFLAAERTGQAHGFEHEQSTVTPLQVGAMERQPGIRRALELFILGHEAEARQEWNYVIYQLDGDRLLAAAHVAQDWAWHDRAIQVTIAGQLWNHLHLRFPTGWREEFIRHARLQNIDRWWAFAIARQESAYRPDARSSANATGLMQLLPSTAKKVAGRIGAPYQGQADLEQPALNVRLGTAYLGEMLRQFDGVLAHASAAYNAGPGRSEAWLKAAPDLPLDAWIETIPFGETRGYVKNVLSFRLIYAYLEGRSLNSVLDN